MTSAFSPNPVPLRTDNALSASVAHDRLLGGPMERSLPHCAPPALCAQSTEEGGRALRWLLILSFLIQFIPARSVAQDTAAVHNLGMFFPDRRECDAWNLSLGFVTFTTPEDITEEVRVRIPAGDVHVVRHLYQGLYLDGRLLAQGVQNHLSVGARWATRLSDKFTFSVGDDVAYWRGNLPIQGFDSKARGWMNYPCVSFGYRSKRDLLFTVEGRMLITTNYELIIGDRKRTDDSDRVSGSAWSFYVEQPFFKRSYITLGFTLAYTNFLWATWSLFETFDRNLLYPQITTALIL